MAGRLGGRLARFLSEKLDDPRSREAARKALRKVTGEESSRHTTEGERTTHGDYISGLGPVEVGDRAGFELRDRVAEALRLYRHDAELLDGALRQALAQYDRKMLGDPEGRYPDMR